MSGLFIKICGLSTARDVDAAVAAGADALGFVFSPSVRRVEPSLAADLCRAIPAGVLRVAVMHHPTAAEWAEVARVLAPDVLQADAEDFAALGSTAAGRLPVYRDVPDLDEDALAREDLVLFEAGRSGQGLRADWERAARLARATRLILAGGLTPDNVAEAIGRVRPYGVDVSSGIESARGIKDPARIAAFVAAARSGT